MGEIRNKAEMGGNKKGQSKECQKEEQNLQNTVNILGNVG